MYIFFFQMCLAFHIFTVLQKSLALCLCDFNLKHSKKIFISSSMFVLASLKVDKGSEMIGGSLSGWSNPWKRPLSLFLRFLFLRDVPDIPFSAPCRLLAVIWSFTGCSLSCVYVDLGGGDGVAADKCSQLSWPSWEKWEPDIGREGRDRGCSCRPQF